MVTCSPPYKVRILQYLKQTVECICILKYLKQTDMWMSIVYTSGYSLPQAKWTYICLNNKKHPDTAVVI